MRARGVARSRAALCIQFIRRFIFEIYARKVYAARGDEIDAADDDDDVGNDVGDGEDTARSPVSTARIQFNLQFRGPICIRQLRTVFMDSVAFSARDRPAAR